jgi:hypothetical protein
MLLTEMLSKDAEIDIPRVLGRQELACDPPHCHVPKTQRHVAARGYALFSLHPV